MPDFFIVGSTKAGTTALYRALRTHPQVFMAQKEPRFFDTDFFDSDLRAGLQLDKPRLKNRPTTLQEYLAPFAEARPEQRVGEASPSYLRSRVAPGRIAELRPDARIIAILREPASLLRSLHQMFLRIDAETETDLRRAVSLEAERAEGRHIPRSCINPPALQYSDHARYLEHLRRYRAHFPPEQMLILIYDDFRADNAAVHRRVERFLEIDDQQAIDVGLVNVTTAAVRAPHVKQMLQSATMGKGPIARSTRTAVKAVTPRRLRRGAISAARRRVVYAELKPPDELFELELRRRFKDEVAALSEYLRRDLVTLWGYDEID